MINDYPLSQRVECMNASCKWDLTDCGNCLQVINHIQFVYLRPCYEKIYFPVCLMPATKNIKFQDLLSISLLTFYFGQINCFQSKATLSFWVQPLNSMNTKWLCVDGAVNGENTRGIAELVMFGYNVAIISGKWYCKPCVCCCAPLSMNKSLHILI